MSRLKSHVRAYHSTGEYRGINGKFKCEFVSCIEKDLIEIGEFNILYTASIIGI